MLMQNTVTAAKAAPGNLPQNVSGETIAVMLRVGLTGGLGVASQPPRGCSHRWARTVLQSDAIGRELMEPGQGVYTAIADHFGKGVVQQDGGLDRSCIGEDRIR